MMPYALSESNRAKCKMDLGMTKRYFVVVTFVLVVVFSCTLSGVLLYQQPRQSLYPNATISNDEGAYNCELNSGIGCLRATTFYTDDSPETVKSQLMKASIFISYDQGTNYATISNSSHSLNLNLFGLDRLSYSQVKYLYLYDEEDQTRLTQTTYTTFVIHRHP